jgi:hypothetical protein
MITDTITLILTESHVVYAKNAYAISRIPN